MRIAHGVTRTVLLTHRYAIKIPRLRWPGRGFAWSLARGFLANQSEREWSAYGGVAPVLWSLGSLVNVYPRADPVPDGTVIDYAAILGHPTPVDAKPSNVGVLHGRLVWIDYDMNWNDCRRCGQPVIDPAALASDETL